MGVGGVLLGQLALGQAAVSVNGYEDFMLGEGQVEFA